MAELRPYQKSFCDAILGDLRNFSRVLGVAPTGSGKTIMAAELIARHGGRSLFLADAKELVYQAADKIQSWNGIIPEIEMGDSRSEGMSRIVVGTTQSLARRLDGYSSDSFGLIVVDEAHRNSIGNQAQKVLNYFQSAKVVGITATPFRSDRKALSAFFEHVSYEIGLFELIQQGHLSRIMIKSVPVNVDLKNVRTSTGDYDENDLAEAISPHLRQCAELLKEHAGNRKTVVFLPLIETSKAFCKICREIGLNAVHVDGENRDALRTDWNVICNASLLTTGWDEPTVDCVYILRPTKSQVLFSQMVGRGTRIAPGKENMLLLDPLFLTDDLSLIRPARLIAHDAESAKFLQHRLDMGGGDLMFEAEKAAEERIKADRAESLEKNLSEKCRRKSRTIDAFDLATSLDRDDITFFEPKYKWESQAVSDGQLKILQANNFDIYDPRMCKGFAHRIIDMIFQRRAMGLATPKQVRMLDRLGIANINRISFEDAKRIISQRIGASHDN